MNCLIALRIIFAIIINLIGIDIQFLGNVYQMFIKCLSNVYQMFI